MKTIGLIGGMSWESSLSYYRLINELVRARLGGLHSAKLVLYSVDFAEVEPLQRSGDWDAAAAKLAAAAQALQAAGADFLLLCTNTMHKVASSIETATTIPLLHIADATALAVRREGLSTIGLLGTRFTMEQDFYVERLRQHGVQVLIPPPADRQIVHDVIYEELCRGQIRDASRVEYQRIVTDLCASGAQGVILGCTEIGLLIGANDVAVAVFDTTVLHAEAAVEQALGASQTPVG